MNQVGFAPAASINLVRMTIAALIAVGVFAVAMLSGPATASADTNNCSGSISVACVGQVNGNLVNVNVGDVNAVSGNELNTLSNNLNQAYVAVANIGNVNILAVQLTTLVQTAVNNWIPTTVNNTVNTITKTCAPFVVPAPVPTGTSTITITCS
jgi:hypothetical protein